MRSTLFLFVLISSFILGDALSSSKAKDIRARKSRTRSVTPSSTDINACLFSSWKVAGILSTSPTCNKAKQAQLCYGLPGKPAKFAVCYNTARKIPKYTGYVIPKGPSPRLRRKRPRWASDRSLQMIGVGQASHASYSSIAQMTNYGPETVHQWNQRKNYFLSRGHLTPNAAFQSTNERALTFVLTNAAPQWQKFNGGNWRILEEAVKAYANDGHEVYVFTGVAGRFRDESKTNPLPYPFLLGVDEVTVPKYFWTVVCDPVKGQSIAFIAKNNVGDKNKTQKTGCNSEKMTSENGVIQCMCVFKFTMKYPRINSPMFNHQTCRHYPRGTFLDGSYRGKFQ